MINNIINNIDDLKNYNIICTNTDEVEECLDILEKLGFKTDKEIYPNERIVKTYDNEFFSTNIAESYYKDINFRSFKKQTKKFLKEIEEKLPDFECDENGKIIKINNWKSDKKIYEIDFIGYRMDNFISIKEYDKIVLDNYIKCGLIFNSKEALDNFIKYLTIHTKLKNLANRLNSGVKFDWEDDTIQKKYYFRYDYETKKLYQDFNFSLRELNVIYCLDENFLEIAKKEIGEENLLKLFED